MNPQPQAKRATYSRAKEVIKSRQNLENGGPVAPSLGPPPRPSNLMINQHDMSYSLGPFPSSPFSSGPNMPSNLPMTNWSSYYNPGNMPPIPPFPMFPIAGYPFHHSMTQMSPYHPNGNFVFPSPANPASPASPHIPSPITPPNDSPKPKTRAKTCLTNRPSYAKGSIIKLADGSFKRVEDMKTRDFLMCVKLTPDAELQNSKVLAIKAENNNIKNEDLTLNPEPILITFDVNGREEIVVEAPSELPFFIYDLGWSAYSPERCKKFYGLEVRKLTVGDNCISLAG